MQGTVGELTINGGISLVNKRSVLPEYTATEVLENWLGDLPGTIRRQYYLVGVEHLANSV